MDELGNGSDIGSNSIETSEAPDINNDLGDGDGVNEIDSGSYSSVDMKENSEAVDNSLASGNSGEVRNSEDDYSDTELDGEAAEDLDEADSYDNPEVGDSEVDSDIDDGYSDTEIDDDAYDDIDESDSYDDSDDIDDGYDSEIDDYSDTELEGDVDDTAEDQEVDDATDDTAEQEEAEDADDVSDEDTESTDDDVYAGPEEDGKESDSDTEQPEEDETADDTADDTAEQEEAEDADDVSDEDAESTDDDYDAEPIDDGKNSNTDINQASNEDYDDADGNDNVKASDGDFVFENQENFENCNYHQGQNDLGALGTCGPTSIANSLNRVTGTNEYTENDVLHIAMDNDLCHMSDNPYSCGGTTTSDVVNIIDVVKDPEGNIHTEVYEYDNALDVDSLADRVDDPGTVAMVGVDSATLWDQRGDVSNSGLFSGCSESPSDHWITVDSPVRDENGGVTGFNIIDSGGGVAFADRDKFERMYMGDDSHRVTDPTAVIITNKGEAVKNYSQPEGIERTANYKESADVSSGIDPPSGLFSNEIDKVDVTSTKIDGIVVDVEQVTLPESVASTFKEGQYRTVVTTEPITLYRTFGGDASVGGAFVTTETSVSEEESRQKTALLPEWNNTCEYEATIIVPPGETLNIGKAEEQYDSYTGKKYEGGGDQILMPQDWYKNHPDWVANVRKLK